MRAVITNPVNRPSQYVARPEIQCAEGQLNGRWTGDDGYLEKRPVYVASSPMARLQSTTIQTGPGTFSCANSGNPRVSVADTEEKSIQRRIFELQVEHRDLNEVVDRLSADPNVDQLMMQRLKRRRLQLKDQINRLKSQLIPDIDA